MNLTAHLQSLTDELQSVKDRVRNIIQDKHWQTDGEWKETVIMQVLRRMLPHGTAVGRGFIVHPTYTSTQLDLILHDSFYPRLFEDGNLVMVTPNAIKAVVEVKTRVTKSSLKKALKSLAETAKAPKDWDSPARLRGLFVYEDMCASDAQILEIIRDASGDDKSGVINIVSIGTSRFFRWWYRRPNTNYVYESWHSYKLANMAPGYFLHNLLEHLFPKAVTKNPESWFPVGGKEVHKTGEIEHLKRTKAPFGGELVDNS